MRTASLSPLLCAAALLCGVACTSESTTFAPTATVASGVPGSLAGAYARMLVVDDYLYAVNQTDMITYDIADRDAPAEVDRQRVGSSIETLFHHDGNLFVGSREGMYTYTLGERGVPERRGQFDYATLPLEVMPCDPVVANSATAYATLYTSEGFSNDGCGRTLPVQSLVAMDVTDLTQPTLIRMYDVTTPRGLSLDGDLLFVGNDVNGVTVFDVSDPAEARELSYVPGVHAFDVIARDGLLIVVGDTELVQFDYSDPTQLVELNHLPYPRA